MNTKHEIADYNNAFDEEIIHIIIITGASSFAGAEHGDEKLWDAQMQVTAWKLIDSAEINRGAYLLVTKTDDEYFQYLQKKALPDSIISVKVRRKDNDFLLVEFAENEIRNIPMEKILKEQKKPVFYKDAMLGKFVLNRNINCFEGKLKWRNKKIDLTVQQYTEKKIKDAFVTASTLIKRQIVWDEKLKRFAANKLLKLKNTVWLGEDEQKITFQEFIKRIKTEHIKIYPKGKFEFCFDDANIFRGHRIVVSGSLEKGPAKAELI